MDPVGQKSIFGQKIISSIFPKICPKTVPTDLKSNFSRKMRNSNFRSKTDPGGIKSIFGPKIESFIFQPKLAKKMLPKGIRSIFG